MADYVVYQQGNETGARNRHSHEPVARHGNASTVLETVLGLLAYYGSPLI